MTLKTFLDFLLSPIRSSSMAFMVFCSRSGLLALVFVAVVALAFGLSADGDAGGSAGDRQRSAESVRCILSRMELQVCRRIASLVEKVCLHWDLQRRSGPSGLFDWTCLGPELSLPLTGGVDPLTGGVEVLEMSEMGVEVLETSDTSESISS